MSARPAQRLLALAASAAAVVALAACSSDPADSTDEAAASGASGETETVTVGTLRGQPHFYAPFLYEEYAEEGVEFEVVILDSTPSLSDALVSGAVDFAVTGVTSTVSSIAQDRDLKIVASAADGGWGFLGNDIDSVSDLVGKKVGYIQGSAPEVALRLILEEEGIDPADLELVTVAPPELASALASGSIDAFFGVEIGVSLAKAAGSTEIADPYSTSIGQVNIGLATRGDLIEENPDLVQKVVDTHVATTAYMSENVDEWLPDMVAEFGGDQEVLETALENFTLRSDLSQEYLTQVEALVGEMAGLGLIDEAPAIEDIVDTTFAPED
ncbi:ABC transporter substrate-binding protein [Blastococcus sp. SYSU DS0619]